MDLLQEFYETTLEALKDAKNDRLWFKTNTKVTIIITYISSLLKSGRVSLVNSPKDASLVLLKFFDFNVSFFTAWKIVFRTGGIWKASKNFTPITSVLPGSIPLIFY